MTGSIVSAGDLERYCTTHELVLLYDRVSFSPLHSRGAVAISQLELFVSPNFKGESKINSKKQMVRWFIFPQK